GAAALLGLFQPLDDRRDQDGKPDGGVHEYLPEFPAFRRGNKLAPGNRLAVWTPRQSAPIHRFRTDPQAVVIALEGYVFAQAAVPQFDKRPELLRPVARHDAADGEDTQFFLAQQGGGKMLQVFKGVEADLVATGGVAQAIVQRSIEAQFGIAECG